MKQDYWDQVLWEAARKDPEYQQLLTQCRAAEQDYFEILESLPPERREQLQDYISLCEELERRLAELALQIPRG